MAKIKLGLHMSPLTMTFSDIGSFKLTEIGSSENALHRVVGIVTCVCSPSLVAGSAQVIIIADQAFVSATAEISF